MLFSKRTDLDLLRAELTEIDADVAATDARAREVERARTPGSGFDPSVKDRTDETLRKLGEQRAALLARRRRVAPAVEALARLEAAQSALPKVLATAQLPQDQAEAAGALDAALEEACARESAARAVHEVAKRQAAEAELAGRQPQAHHDPTRGPRLRAIADANYRTVSAAFRQVQALAAAQVALDELVLLEHDAQQALANLDTPKKSKAAAA
jgi:hypothetical protein